jgi:hypothetical protein
VLMLDEKKVVVDASQPTLIRAFKDRASTRSRARS